MFHSCLLTLLSGSIETGTGAELGWLPGKEPFPASLALIPMSLYFFRMGRPPVDTAKIGTESAACTDDILPKWLVALFAPGNRYRTFLVALKKHFYSTDADTGLLGDGSI